MDFVEAYGVHGLFLLASRPSRRSEAIHGRRRPGILCRRADLGIRQAIKAGVLHKPRANVLVRYDVLRAFDRLHRNAGVRDEQGRLKSDVKHVSRGGRDLAVAPAPNRLKPEYPVGTAKETAVNPVPSNDSSPILSLRLEGAAVTDGSIPLGRFGRFADALDRAIRRLGENILKSVSPEATAEERANAMATCELRLGVTKRGSYVLDCFRPREPATPCPEVADLAVESLLDGVVALTDAALPLPSAFDDDVASACAVMGRVFKHGVERIEFASVVRDRRRTAVFRPASVANLKVRRSAKRPVAREVVGRLQMADLDRTRRRCRIAPQVGEPVECEFESVHEAVVAAHLGAFVRVLGVATEVGGLPDKGRLRIDRVEPIFNGDGVRGGGSGIYAPGASPPGGARRPATDAPHPASARELWTDDADFDAFLLAVRSARHDLPPPSAP